VNHLADIDYFIAGPLSFLTFLGTESCTLQFDHVNVEGNCYLVARGGAIEICDIVSKINGINPGTVCRLMDRVFFVQEQGSLWASGYAFFEIAAPEYETMISMERNSACAAHLLRSALVAYGGDQSTRVLDFGCGTGVSSTVMQAAGVDVVSYDCCSAMRDHARRFGLRVVNAISDCESGSIDVVVACYVMHYGIRESDAVELARVLSVGGLLAANFHKGLGIIEATNLLRCEGFSVLEDKVDSFDKYGQTVVFRWGN